MRFPISLLLKARVPLLLALMLCGQGCFLDKSKDPDPNHPGSEGDIESFGPYASEGLDRATLTDERVIRAMSQVPRHRFVPVDEASDAYEDRALPIGFQQTISQPYIVALMTQESLAGPGSKVLEIGTGSGYQAAVLAQLGADVFTIEIIPELAERARSTLSELGFEKVSVKTGDGWEGWAEHAPFDAILVTAAAPEPPPKLLSQLANRGRMVIPIEKAADDGEVLMVIERRDRDYVTRRLGAVRFVPLMGEGRKLKGASDTETNG